MNHVFDCSCKQCSDKRLLGGVPNVTLRDLQHSIKQWADEVFPDRTVKSSLGKLMVDEIPELRGKLDDELEYADVLIMVLDLASQMGIDAQNAVIRKMAINRERKWGRDPATGFYQHVEES